MALRTVLKYTALAIAALLLASVVVSVVAAVLGLVWAILTTVVTLLAVGGLLYGGFKAYGWLSDGESSADDRTRDRSNARPETTDDRIARLRERYASGEISEAELERRLELELDGPETDGIDRELNRERS